MEENRTQTDEIDKLHAVVAVRLGLDNIRQPTQVIQEAKEYLDKQILAQIKTNFPTI